MKRTILTLCALMLITTHETQGATFQELFEAGNQHFRSAEFHNAITQYEQALEHETAHPQPYLNLGLAYRYTGRLHEAALMFRAALERDPNYAKAHWNLADMLIEQSKLPDAEKHLRRAHELEPENIDVLKKYARVLREQNKFNEAIVLLKKALNTRPDEVSVMLDLANTLNMNGEPEQALELYHALLEEIGNNPHVLYNIAYTLKKLGKAREAIPLYERVLELTPDLADGHFGLGLSHLLLGEFERGFEEYEWRWHRSGYTPRTFTQPVWDGCDLTGKTLYLHAEQGLGDTFQFIRYARIAKERGAHVIVSAQSPLITLLGLCPYIDSVVEIGNHPNHFDYHAALLSMPYILKTTLETVPDQIPYLYADHERVAYWEEQLCDNTNFKIGICWQGNPNYSTHFLRHAVAAKSVSLAQFAPLFTVPNVSVYSLQRVTGTDQLDALPSNAHLHTFGPEFDRDHGRFMDTAALIKNLDLVITVDTSIAHLAGGLGVPVWLLVPTPPDWRWMLDTTPGMEKNTPWYPNVELFRQPEPGDWHTVMQTLKARLHIEADQNLNTTISLIDSPGKLTQKLHALTPTQRHQVTQVINALLSERYSVAT